MADIDRKKPLTEADKANAVRLEALWKRHKGKRTQEDAAEYMGITQGAVSHYIKGRVALNVEAILKFSSFLKIDPDEISVDFDYGFRLIPKGYIKPSTRLQKLIDVFEEAPEQKDDDLWNGVEDQERRKTKITPELPSKRANIG